MSLVKPGLLTQKILNIIINIKKYIFFLLAMQVCRKQADTTPTF